MIQYNPQASLLAGEIKFKCKIFQIWRRLSGLWKVKALFGDNWGHLNKLTLKMVLHGTFATTVSVAQKGTRKGNVMSQFLTQHSKLA